MSKSGQTVSFTHNEDGLRVQKNAGGTVTISILPGKNVVHWTQGSNSLHFFHGADGSPAVVYNGASYGYVKEPAGRCISKQQRHGSWA